MKIEEALASRPPSGYQYYVAVLLCLTIFIEGYDSVVMSLSVASIAQEWGVKPSRFSLALSMPLISTMFAAVLIAPLSHRYGRRPLLVSGVFLTGLGMFVTVSTQVMPIFLAGRALTGIGLGIAFPISLSLLADIMPPKQKRFFVALSINCLGLGAASSAFSAAILNDIWGWRGLFYAAIVLPTLMGVVLLMTIPESPSYLLLSGQAAKARQVLRKMGIPDSMDVQHPGVAAKRSGASVLALFGNGMATMTLIIWAFFFLRMLESSVALYWFPTLLEMSGFQKSQVFVLMGLGQTTGIIGGLMYLYFIGRGWIFTSIGVSLAVAILALFAMGTSEADFALFSFILVASHLFSGGAVVALNTLLVSIYPSEMQVTGLGWAIFAGRAGSIISVFVGGFLIDTFTPSAIFLLLTVPLVLCGVCALFLARQYRQRPEPAGPALMAGAGPR